MTGYVYSTSLKTGAEKRKAIAIIKRGVRSDKTTKQIQDDLKAAGLGQRRQTVQQNVRRVKSFIDASTPEKRAKAVRYYDNVYAPLRAKYEAQGLNRFQIRDRFARSAAQSYENLTALELDAVLAIRELYQKQADAGLYD